MADPLYEPVLELQTICLARATGNGGDDRRYRQLRTALIAEQRTRDRLPPFVRVASDLGAFWSYIQPVGGYVERRTHIREGFRALLRNLESEMPGSAREVEEILARVNADTVREVWERAQNRRSSDPDGAITLARTLLETVCKHILHTRHVEYASDADLPVLYRATAETLKIAPSDATEDAFRRIFGACTSIVVSVGTIRSHIGDAHGHGPEDLPVDARYARLAVNLAGTMSTFLVESSEAAT